MDRSANIYVHPACTSHLAKKSIVPKHAWICPVLCNASMGKIHGKKVKGFVYKTNSQSRSIYTKNVRIDFL